MGRGFTRFKQGHNCPKDIARTIRAELKASRLQRIKENMQEYVERSPSKNGLRVLNFANSEGVDSDEIFSSGAYLLYDITPIDLGKWYITQFLLTSSSKARTMSTVHRMTNDYSYPAEHLYPFMEYEHNFWLGVMAETIFQQLFGSKNAESAEIFFAEYPVSPAIKELTDRAKAIWDSETTEQHDEIYLEFVDCFANSMKSFDSASWNQHSVDQIYMCYIMQEDSYLPAYIHGRMYSSIDLNELYYMVQTKKSYDVKRRVVFEPCWEDDEMDNVQYNVGLLLANQCVSDDERPTEDVDEELSNLNFYKDYGIASLGPNSPLGIYTDNFNAENECCSIIVELLVYLQVKRFVAKSEWGHDLDEVAKHLVELMQHKISTPASVYYDSPGALNTAFPEAYMLRDELYNAGALLAEKKDLLPIAKRIIYEYFFAKTVCLLMNEKLPRDINRYMLFHDYLHFSDYDIGALEAAAKSQVYLGTKALQENRAWKDLTMTCSLMGDYCDEQSRALVSDKHDLEAQIRQLQHQLEDSEKNVTNLRNKLAKLESQPSDKSLKKQVNKEHAENERLRRKQEKLEKEIERLNAHAEYTQAKYEEFIDHMAEDSSSEEVTTDQINPEIYSLNFMLVHGAISEYWPQARQDYVNATFFESATTKLTGANPEVIVLVTSNMSHSMYRAIMSYTEHKDIPIIYCNSKNYKSLGILLTQYLQERHTDNT